MKTSNAFAVKLIHELTAAGCMPEDFNGKVACTFVNGGDAVKTMLRLQNCADMPRFKLGACKAANNGAFLRLVWENATLDK